MQNQCVFSVGKSFLGHFFSGSIVKSLGLPQQRNVLPHLKNDLQSRNYTETRDSASTLLLSGGLCKLQGSFKEEQYFSSHEQMLVSQLQQTGYRLKCESAGNCNWREFERMANDLTQLTAVRQSGQLGKYKNCLEESFFLQEQRSLLERVIDALRRFFPNRDSDELNPYGSKYYNSQTEEDTEKEDESNDNDTNKTISNKDERVDKPLEEINDILASEDKFSKDPDNLDEQNDGRGDGQRAEGQK